MKTKFILAIVLCILVLSGCQSSPPVVQTVYVDRVRIPDIPTHYLEGCSITAPPSKIEYLELDLEQREGVLTSYITALMSDLDKCGIKIKSIDSIITKFKNQYR